VLIHKTKHQTDKTKKYDRKKHDKNTRARAINPEKIDQLI
jgi:hypothetical protein